MRIACLHVPQFALQCVTRVDPSLRSAAVAVAGATMFLGDAQRGATGRASPHGPVVQACSRAAWALGCRVGMTATAVRALSPQLVVVAGDAALERETMRALADVLMGVAPTVEAGARVGMGGAHLAMYCEVPVRTRGSSFGDKLVARIELLGITARVGIADDRFTAWVAASERGEGEADIISVPRGGSAAYLAPRPLSLLGITPEVQHMLGALGVHTLGEFGSLPAPSVARPFEADFQGLARGESGHALREYLPEAPIREEVAVVRDAAEIHAAGVLHGPTGGERPFNAPALPTSGASARGQATSVGDRRSTPLSGPAAIAVLAERLALRLAGRGRGAASLELAVARGDGTQRVRPFGPRTAMSGILSSVDVLESAEEIAEAIAAALGDDLHEVVRLGVAITGEGVAGEAGELAAAAAAAALGEQGALAAIPRSIAAAPALSLRDGRHDVLGVVLATTGSTRESMFGLTSPSFRPERAERRDAHQRVQRGKHRRRARAGEQLAQPRLFKDVM